MAIQLKKILPFLSALLLCAPVFAHAFVIGMPPNDLGLVAYWPLNEGSGTTVYDRSGNGFSGTLEGSPAWVSGKFGEALSLNGSGQYVATTYTIPPQTSATSFTWSAWVDLNSGNEPDVVILGYRSGSTWVKITPTQFEWSGGIITYSVPTGSWVLLTVVKSGANFTYYEDGSVVGTASNSSSVASNTFYIGEDPNFSGDGSLSGAVSNVRVYDRALSATEVAALYGTQSTIVNAASLNGNNGLSGSLTASWSFDSSTVSGSTVEDISGNGHNLTLENGASIAPGYQGDALTLDGTDQYAAGEVGTLPTSVSLSMWVKANDVSTEQSILVEQDSETANTGYHFTLVGIYNGAFYAGFWDIGDIASSPITAGTWYHVILTYDGVAQTQSLYVNGVLQGTQSGSWSPPSTIYFLPGLAQEGCSFTSASGHCNDDANYFNGQIDELQAYDQAFSSSDVAELSGSTATLNASSAALTDGSSLGNGLVGLWTFDGKDMYQNVADESGNGYTGYMEGFTSTTSAETIGKLGQALKFNGSSSYVELPDLPSLSNYTISFWAKPSNCGTSSEIQLFDSPDDNIGISCKPDGVLQNWAGGSSYPITGSGVISNGQWIYITVTSDGGNNDLYINGALNTTGTAGDSFSGGTAYIGQLNGGGRNYGGVIDDFRLYDRALSASEVQELYELGE